MKQEIQDFEVQVNLFQRNRLNAVGAVANNIAHEVNGSLQSILLCADKLKRLVKKNDISENQFNLTLNKIEDKIFEISKVIENTRQISRDSYHDAYKSEKIISISDDILGYISTRLENRGISLKIAIDATLTGVTVNCQRMQIIQLLLNIINNSIVAMDNLQEKWLAVSVYRENQWCCIRVTDSGCGINESMAKKLFKPFVTSSENISSIRLGLSISSEIAIRNGGMLTYEPLAGNTSFILKLPNTM